MVRRGGIGLLVLLLFSAPCAAQEDDWAGLSLEELWRVGSLWQVGENVERVREAREELVRRGDEGLAFALGRLDAGATLEKRCLFAVLGGFGDAALAGLLAAAADARPTVRANAATLLGRLSDPQVAEVLLPLAESEEDVSVLFAQLQALSARQEPEALPLVEDFSRRKNERARLRSCDLLACYGRDGAPRLLEMLSDLRFFVRAGACAALGGIGAEALPACLDLLEGDLQSSEDSPEATARAGLLLRVLAEMEAEVSGDLAARATALLDAAAVSSHARVRGEWAAACAAWLRAGRLRPQDAENAEAKLRAAANTERDPFAKACIEEALRVLAEGSDQD